MPKRSKLGLPEKYQISYDTKHGWVVDCKGNIVSPKIPKQDIINVYEQGFAKPASQLLRDGYLTVYLSEEEDFKMCSLYSLEEQKWVLKAKSEWDIPVRAEHLLKILNLNIPKLKEYKISYKVWGLTKQGTKLAGSDRGSKTTKTSIFEAFVWGFLKIRKARQWVSKRYFNCEDEFSFVSPSRDPILEEAKSYGYELDDFLKNDNTIFIFGEFNTPLIQNEFTIADSTGKIIFELITKNPKS